MNIVSIAYDNITAPITITVVSFEFCNKYSLANSSVIIMNEEYEDGNIVIVNTGRNFALAEYVDGKLIDIVDNKEITQTEEINIVGSAYGKFELF